MSYFFFKKSFRYKLKPVPFKASVINLTDDISIHFCSINKKIFTSCHFCHFYKLYYASSHFSLGRYITCMLYIYIHIHKKEVQCQIEYCNIGCPKIIYDNNYHWTLHGSTKGWRKRNRLVLIIQHPSAAVINSNAMP